MEVKIEKKLVKLGRSRGIIIPPWMLLSLNINPNEDDIILSIKDNKIIIEKKQ